MVDSILSAACTVVLLCFLTFSSIAIVVVAATASTNPPTDMRTTRVVLICAVVLSHVIFGFRSIIVERNSAPMFLSVMHTAPPPRSS